MELFESILEQKLAKRLEAPVSLTITDNSNSMLYIWPKDGEYKIRLHHMFLDADDEVLDDLVRYAKTGRSKRIQKYIDSHSDWISHTKHQKKVRVRHKGEIHNLKPLYDEINREYFESRVNCRITWGRRMKKKSRRYVRFGSYCFEDNLIRVHSRLDSDRVPLYFLKYIIFHEMLHADMGYEEGRKHTGAFAKREKAYPDYQRAVKWSNENIRMFVR